MTDPSVHGAEGDERIRTAVPSVAIESEYEGENARRILHEPRKSGIVGRWRVGDVVETQAQADVLQGILDGSLVVVARAAVARAGKDNT